MKQLHCLLTNDVETHSIWFNCLRDETGRNVLNHGLPRLLEIYADHDIRCTFFFTGYIARKFPEVVKMILPFGHEVGCHGLSHEVEHMFDVMDYAQQVEHLRTAKGILEDLAGQPLISFRAPALRVNRFTPRALAVTGFKIDSSVASQRFDMFLSFGSIRKLRWLSAPRRPFRTHEDDLFRRGDGPIIEVPLSAMLFPYVGTTMRTNPRLARCTREVLHWECGLSHKPIVFDIHPNEFLEEHNGETNGRRIARRSRNPVLYLLGDVIRSKVKVRNLGAAAASLYVQEIELFKRRNYKFHTMRDYVRELGFML